MKYKIIGDSCMDLTEEMKNSEVFASVPLMLYIEEETIPDDESFDQKLFLKKMKESQECPRSSCPSPEEFEKYFGDAKEVYVITLSSELSGSYNSAMLAKRDYMAKHPDTKIEVIDSKSASTGETLIGHKIHDLKRRGSAFDEVLKKITNYRNEMQTKFVLESLENLKKNGRLSHTKAFICDVLNIKPIMKATSQGTIEKEGQARGIKSALLRMVAQVAEEVKDSKDRVLAISHCNNRERAEFVKRQIEKVLSFREIIIVEQKGVSTMYANEGGIIISY